MVTLIFAHHAHSSAGTEKETREPSALSRDLWHDPYIKVFRGHHVAEKLSTITVVRPIVSWNKTQERIGAVTTGTKIIDLLGGALTIEWEGMYADHWGTKDFDEMATAVYARWNRFPWNDYIRTTFAIGTGPSITTKPAPYEPKGGLRSRWLMQLNFEINIYSPSKPDWALLFRIQHRSGAAKIINNVRGGSNFLTMGLRKNF